jgi:hypothetical protein
MRHVAIFVEGGVIQNIVSDRDVKVRIINWDELEEEHQEVDSGWQKPDYVLRHYLELHVAVNEAIRSEGGKVRTEEDNDA